MKKEMKIKHCGNCKTDKDMNEFYNSYSSYDGLSSHCKVCSKARVKLWGKNNPDKRRHNALKKLYGITLDQYNEMLVKQDFKCSICKRHKDMVANKTHLSVDHNHNTNEIRGLLCSPCNQAIGLLQESIEACENAAKYLYAYNQIKKA